MLLLLIGCGATPEQALTGVGALGVGSIAVMQRSPFDAIYSVITGKDCSVVRLEQGKNYVIDMRADVRTSPGKIDPKNPPHDPLLHLLDPKGKEVSSNDDFEPGTSYDARIRYTASESGEYTIQASHFLPLPPAGMPFTLTVKQE